MNKTYCTAIVLAGGSGKRMGTKVHKQYLSLGDAPVLYYSLKTFQESNIIDEIVLVTGNGEEEYCRETIIEKYNLTKVKHIVAGGAERYDSVWNGLKKKKDVYVFIHDGARPFVDEKMIERAYYCVETEWACVAGMPVKDTIKIVDPNKIVKETPDRSAVWMIQTPQVFDVALVQEAYAKLMEKKEKLVTDDAMVVEKMIGHPVKVFEGDYENIKITTPEDLGIAKIFLEKREKNNIK